MRHTLYIGNKNYSSWSMRPWLLMKQADIPFTEVKLRLFNHNKSNSSFKKSLEIISSAQKVPVLVDHDQADLMIWDSLAICEYIAEQYPEKKLWPTDLAMRATARSVCAEMHSGFMALRSQLLFNVEANLPRVGQIFLRDDPKLNEDIERIFNLWSDLLNMADGPFLFGDFTVADAYYAPICIRLLTYRVNLPEQIADYVKQMRALPSFQQWVKEACDEHDFLPAMEPYRLSDEDVY